MKAFVYSVSRYDFETEDGKKLRGTKIGILDDTEGNPNRVGYVSMLLQSDNFELFDSFPCVGHYELEVKMMPGAKGVPRLVPLSATLLQGVKIL